MTDLPAREGLATVLALVGTKTDGDYLSRLANGERIAIQCAEWVRDHGAALLAEVERLQQELAESQEWQVVFDTGRVEALDRAEAAEQVAREVENLAAKWYGMAAFDSEHISAEQNEAQNHTLRRCAVELRAALNHGARTGESNEA